MVVLHTNVTLIKAKLPCGMVPIGMKMTVGEYPRKE